MPHLQALVERHKDDEFVLIGINAMDSPEAFRKGLEEYGVTWLSAYQGQAATPISNLYAVQGYPSYVLIDAQGKIQERAHGTDVIDKRIVELLKEAEEGPLK